MMGQRIEDLAGVEGPPGSVAGLGWLSVTTRFDAGKVLDRPHGNVVAGPGAGASAAGYRIHHGRVSASPDLPTWIETDDGSPLGWHQGRVLGTTLHGLFEDDGLRAGLLRWVAEQAGLPAPAVPLVDFAAARLARLDHIADVLEAHLDMDRLKAIIELGAC
jgi:adenosylcobyric acid synthase